jgi:hypothetical protein
MINKYYAGISKYNDDGNYEDKGNECYYIILSPDKPYILDEVEDHFYNEEISNKTGINFINLAKKYNGFEDGKCVFFHRKKDAIGCMKEMLSIINN